MAAMSVIGIDFGNEACYVAVAKAGGIETIANDYSLRATPACVAFSQKNRILGVAAKNQQLTNMKNTVYSFKRLLGRQFDDPHVTKELRYLPFQAKPNRNGTIGIKAQYLDEEHIFTPEQCAAMLLTKLKETSTVALQTPINDCVISVPSYFTNSERKALLDAASIAGLNVLRLMNETTATALAYGIYKQDLPGPEEKPRNVIFVDCGQSSLQVSACAFHRGKLRMLATASDPYLGGRDIDLILAEHFCTQFVTKYKVDGRTQSRAFLRLLAEVEKLKKQMSANSTTLPLNIECWMEDKDVRGDMKRSEMEVLCAGLFERVEVTLRTCLEQSKLRPEEIHSVEIVGGSSRIPAIKQLIEQVFNRVPSTTLNQDEAVSRGCALQCAMLSPAVRVREFSVTDVQPYPIVLAWDVSMGEEGQGEMEVFPQNHQVPFSKILTFYRREPFTLSAYYNGQIPFPEKKIGSWTIKDIKTPPEGESQKLKVKIRVNIHGLFSVSSASLYERKDASDEEQDTNESTANNAQEAPATTEDSNNAENVEKKDKKKKNLVKAIDLPIDCISHGYSQVEINNFTEQECKMIAGDRQEKERADARNALEEYVYELRGKLSSDEDLALFVTENDRNTLVDQLDQMENWLYEEGEDCNRQEYHDKLTTLRKQGDPIQNRRSEFDMRPSVIEDFAKTLQLAGKTVDQIRNKDPKFAHLTEEEINQVVSTIQESHKWLEQTRSTLYSSSRHLPPPITVSQIRSEHQNFEQIVVPILNKPVPKPPGPPKEEKKNNENPNSPEKTEKQSEEPQQQPQQKPDDANMEWSYN